MHYSDVQVTNVRSLLGKGLVLEQFLRNCVTQNQVSFAPFCSGAVCAQKGCVIEPLYSGGRELSWIFLLKLILLLRVDNPSCPPTFSFFSPPP